MEGVTEGIVGEIASVGVNIVFGSVVAQRRLAGDVEETTSAAAEIAPLVDAGVHVEDRQIIVKKK